MTGFAEHCAKEGIRLLNEVEVQRALEISGVRI
jgi:hypothetical protein